MGNLCSPPESSQPVGQPPSLGFKLVELNATVDELQLSDLKALQARFTILLEAQARSSHGSRSDPGGGNDPAGGLNFASFEQTFPGIKDWDAAVRRAVFRAFDLSTNNHVDLRDFCRAFAICSEGKRKQKLELVASIFSNLQLDYVKHTRDTGCGVSLTKEQFEKLKQCFNMNARLITEPPTPMSSNGGMGNGGMGLMVMHSGERMLLDVFMTWAEGQPELSDEGLAKWLSAFTVGVMKSPAQELAEVEASFDRAVAEGWGCSNNGGKGAPEPVFLIALRWWMAWCDYVKAPQSIRGQFVSSEAAPSPPDAGVSINGRPDEIDNSSIVGRLFWDVKEGVVEGEDFMLLPKGTWEVLWEVYGGGPALPRHCRFDTPPPEGPRTWHDIRSTLRVDLYPLLLRVSLCYRSVAIAQENRDLPFLISSRMALDSELVHHLSNYFLQGYDPQEAKTQARFWYKRSTRNCGYSHSNSHSRIRSAPADGLQESGCGGSMNRLHPPQDLSVSRRSSVVNTAALLRKPSRDDNPRWIRIDPEMCRDGLRSLNLHHNDSLLMEIKEGSETWPRDVMEEPPNFRLFRVGQRLDAIDHQGKAYTGSVVAVEEVDEADEDTEEDDEEDEGRRYRGGKAGAGGIRMNSSRFEGNAGAARFKIRVRFDNFAPRWDEVYYSDSTKLYPEGGITGVHAKLSPLRNRLKASPMRDARKPALGSHVSAARSGDHQSWPAEASKLFSGAGMSQGVPLRPGACGLVNLGNTCFMNSGLQCLSHTPLLKSYFLSNQFTFDINTKNNLGTQGRIVEDFATLLKALWGGEFTSISPSKFRRTLAKFKPQFAGNEQQDSQEFLNEMLDALHEDVNRVITKPYVQNPDDDESEKRPLHELAAEAWLRHIQRNQSLIVDLFQGQMRCQITCPDCNRPSTTFDPFLFLSVPVPVQVERMVKVMIVPRVRRSHLGMNGNKPDVSVPSPVILGVALPRTCDIAELMQFVSRKTGWGLESFILAEVYRHRMHRLFDAREQLSALRDEDVIVAYERAVVRVGGSSSQPQTPQPPAPPQQQQERRQSVPSRQEGGCLPLQDGPELEEDSDLEEDLEQEQDDASREQAYRSAAGSTASTDTPWPESLEGLTEGMRVDALDYQGRWYVGSVVRVDPRGGYRVLVHFDRFSSRWDEFYDHAAWQAGKILPPYTKTTRRRKLVEVEVVHRRWLHNERRDNLTPSGAGGGEGQQSVDSRSLLQHRRRQSAGSMGGPKELFGLPFMVQCDANQTFRHLYSRVLKQAMRFLSPQARVAVLAKAYRSSPSSSSSLSASTTLADLPFVVRLVGRQAPLMTCGLCRGSTCHGCNLPLDSPNVVGNVMMQSVSLALDWVEPSEYDDALTSSLVIDDYVRELETRYGSKAGVTLAQCLDEYTKEEVLDEDQAWRCGRCKALRKGRKQDTIWFLPDILIIHIKRFQSAGRWRDKVRTRVDFPLEGLDMSRWVYHGDGRAPPKRHEQDLVYDLFGVINHVGGMTGGHYTATCRSRSIHRDGSREGLHECGTGVWRLLPTWLNFDDDYVDIVYPDDIVSTSAYVLFYSRRRFRPSNVLNTWSTHADT